MAGPERPDAEDGAGDPQAGVGRSAVSRLNVAVLRRLNLAGLVTVAATLSTLDFMGAGLFLPCAVVTGLMVLLALPWSWTVFHLEHAEREMAGREGTRRRHLRGAHVVSVLLLLAALGAKVSVLYDASTSDFAPLVAAYRTYVLAAFAIFVLALAGRGSRVGRFLGDMAERPARLMALSFGVVIVFGSFVLTLPVSLRNTADASFLDALFTATSAVCVTGLAVNDIASTYSSFGQGVLLVLIQAGGLGIMVLSAFFVIAAGRKLRVRSTAVLTEMIDAESVATLRRTVRQIVLFTLAFEAAGAALLYAALDAHPEAALPADAAHPAAGAGGHLWWAVFHAVSAFCNAGFSLSRGNMAPFGGSVAIVGTIAALVTAGGVGFPVLDELLRRARARLAGRRPDRASLHLRVTLATSACLTFGGAAVLFALEAGRSLSGLPFGEQVIAAVFQSVTARTAGFNTVDVGRFGPPALVFVSFLMFVGASSGSTGGGIKTSTFAVLLATFRAELRGEAEPGILDRRVPAQTVRRAVAVAVVSTAIASAVFFVLLLVEDTEPMRLFFEAVSAFSTTGLSTGITAGLSPAGKLVLVFAMFVGRIGPLTLALAVAAASAGVRPRFVVPEGRILIG